MMEHVRHNSLAYKMYAEARQLTSSDFLHQLQAWSSLGLGLERSAGWQLFRAVIGTMQEG